MALGRTVHLAVYDTLADWEAGHVLAELRTGRLTGVPFEVVTAAETLEPITTMGGVRIVPDMLLSDVYPSGSALLILPGSQTWGPGESGQALDAARRFLEAGVPVAAICGATEGLARAGLLDDRAHTSASADYLAATGYSGAEHYRDERAVVAGDLITAGPQSPVQFARAVLARLGLADEHLLEAYEAVMYRGDASAYATLASAGQPER